MIPEGYEVTEHVKYGFTKSLTWGICLWIFGSLISLGILAGYYAVFTPSEKPSLSFSIGFWGFLAALATIYPHEALHALAIKWYGKACRFGMQRIGPLPVGFVVYTSGFFTRNQCICVALAPCLVLSVGLLPLVLFWEYGRLVFSFHLAVCAGDLYATWHLLRKSKTVFVGDVEDKDRDGKEPGLIIWSKKTTL